MTMPASGLVPEQARFFITVLRQPVWSTINAVQVEAVLVVAVIVFTYGLVSERLAHWSISGPLVFTALGVALAPISLDAVGGFDEGVVEVLAEATLVLILFADATRIDLRVLRRQARLPARMLGVGLPLTVLAGVGVGLVLLDLSLWEAALLAAILAPTDAALGQAVVANPRVPIRIRQALNVESGLNDGLMLPAITVLLAVAASTTGSAGHGDEAGEVAWAQFVARQLGFGVLVGVAVGLGGGWLLDRAVRRGWVEGAMRQLATLALAAGAFAGAHQLEGNGFVAAFVAGMAFGLVSDHCHSAADFTEDEGQLLALVTFLFFGALLLGPRLDELTPAIALYAVLSLTVVRMVPVALSLIGVGLEPPTLGYLGWFGPRGLASILFGLFVVDEADLAGAETILTVMTWTVAASIVAHGLTAVPFADRYANWFEAMMTPGPAVDPADEMAEAEEVEEMRPRLGR
jgi:NhaP-type Na+/H+ or K+/H+ antiporter